MTRLSRGQAELALSDYNNSTAWYCDTCGKTCEPEAVDIGVYPGQPRAQALSSCCWASMTATNPAEAEEYEEGEGRAMILSFALSMPSNNAWNGKWTGESKRYIKTRNLGRSKTQNMRAQDILGQGNFTYDFGDGWRARITVKEVNGKEAAKIRRTSDGFCGYDWMISSICQKGNISC